MKKRKDSLVRFHNDAKICLLRSNCWVIQGLIPSCLHIPKLFENDNKKAGWMATSQPDSRQVGNSIQTMRT